MLYNHRTSHDSSTVAWLVYTRNVCRWLLSECWCCWLKIPEKKFNPWLLLKDECTVPVPEVEMMRVGKKSIKTNFMSLTLRLSFAMAYLSWDYSKRERENFIIQLKRTIFVFYKDILRVICPLKRLLPKFWVTLFPPLIAFLLISTDLEWNVHNLSHKSRTSIAILLKIFLDW